MLVYKEADCPKALTSAAMQKEKEYRSFLQRHPISELLPISSSSPSSADGPRAWGSPDGRGPLSLLLAGSVWLSARGAAGAPATAG